MTYTKDIYQFKPRKDGWSSVRSGTIAWLLVLLALVAAKAGQAKEPVKKVDSDSLHVIKVVYLSCAHGTQRLNLDQVSPELGWQILAGNEQRNVLQKAYQIQVASSLELLDRGMADYWDTKKVVSDQQLNIRYAGKPLVGKSFQQLFWRVRIWTNQGASGWSQPGSWRMGFMKTADRLGSWIGYEHPFAWDSVKKFPVLSSRYLRKEFKTAKKIKSAIAYISGLGLYELHINGQKAGDAVLSPAPTDYSRTVFYNALDVTELLHRGENAVGVVLGNGRYFAMRQAYKPYKWRTFGFPKLYFQLRIEYEDGSLQNIVSDQSWQLSGKGPIRNNNEYDGETYDARMELPGWDLPGYHRADAVWRPAEVLSAPTGKWTTQLNPLMKVVERVRPVRVLPARGGGFILDMGQNMAGWMRMQLSGKGHTGDSVQLRFAESLVKDGNRQEGYMLYTANLRDARSTDHYIIKGEQKESWAPRFTYHGFRYVEVKGYPQTARWAAVGKSARRALLDKFTAEVVYDDLPESGHFECSDSTLNQIYRNAVWGIKSNYKGMPVDCPQRNERQPWLGDRTTGAYGESFVFNNRLLYDKWLGDIQDAQLVTGSIPDVAPNFWLYYKDDVSWPSTYLTVADMLYGQYGDRQVIKDHYASMKYWIEYMHKRYVKNGLINQDSYGDWCVPPDSLKVIHSNNPAKITEGGLIATATFYHDLRLMEKFAVINGTMEDTAFFNPIAREMKQAFQQKYFHADSGYYGNNTVTANLLPLAFGIAMDKDVQRIFDNIEYKTAVTYNGHISSGVIGIQWLLRTLSRFGRNDLALKVASTRTYPGWGFMVAGGATTIWELWNGNTADPAMNSQNHVMLLGDLLIWLYENQAGIQCDRQVPGFKKIRLAPDIAGHLQYVRADYNTPYGKISSHWNKQGNRWTWEVVIAAGTTAVLDFPEEVTSVQEDGKAITGTQRSETGIRMIKGSGRYTFEGRLKKYISK